MKNYRLISILLTIFIFACSSSNVSEPEAELTQSPDPKPEEIENDINNPDNVDYWDNAELVWSDEFEGVSLSTENWALETGGNGWGNNELQNYQAEGNTEVSDGTLKITAKRNTDNTIEGAFTSARLNSKQSFKFGRMEIRAKLPEYKGNGTWPALWMLGSNIQSVGWPACGEIDMMEYVSFKPNKTHFTIHSTANNHTNGTEITSGAVDLESIEEEFHNFGILWSSKYIKFYVDDIENVQFMFRRPTSSTVENWPFSNNFYFLMNIAVGGNWGGLEGVDMSIFPATMEVDYIRVYQVN